MMKEILAEHYRLISACRHEAQLVASAYGIKIVPPVEVPPPAWEEKRLKMQARQGVKLWKYFSSHEGD